MIKTILWDFDGVIAESVNVKTEAFYEMYLPHGKEIADKVVDHHMAHGGVSRFEKFRIYHENYLNITLNPEQISVMADEFSKLVLSKVVASPYIPGALEFIKNTQNKYEHFVISGTPDSEMKVIAELRNISTYFKRIMGSPKKKAQWINELVQEGLIETETSVFIGDATTDYNAAIETGTKFVLREVDYNKSIFTSYAGTRVPDFLNFHSIIEAL